MEVSNMLMVNSTVYHVQQDITALLAFLYLDLAGKVISVGEQGMCCPKHAQLESTPGVDHTPLFHQKSPRV